MVYSMILSGTLMGFFFFLILTASYVFYGYVKKYKHTKSVISLSKADYFFH